MANVKFTAKDEQFIAACARMNGAVGEMAAKINIQLVNAFKQADYVANNFAKGIGRVEAEFADKQNKLAAEANAAQKAIAAANKAIADSAAAASKRQSDALAAIERRYKDTINSVQNFGQAMSTYVTAPIVGVGIAMAVSFANLDTLDRGLQSVMGSAQAAEKEFNRLREVAKLPGLGLEEAAQGSVMLQAAGMSANFARRELLAVGNALATVGKGKFELERVNNQLVQIYNKTSGFGEDVKTISQSLPQLRKVMLEAFGTMDTEAISKKFTGKEFVEKLVVELEKLPKATGGFKNAWENLTDSLKVGGAEIFKIAEKSFDFTGKLEGLATMIESVANRFKEMNPEAQTAILSITGIVAAIGPLSVAIGAIARALPLLSVGFRVLTGPIGILSTGVILLASNWTTVKTKAYEALYSIGIWVGELLVKMGKALNSTTLLNEGMAQISQSGRFRSQYLPQQSVNSGLVNPDSIYEPLIKQSSGNGVAKSLSDIEKEAKKATKAMIELSDARIKAGLEAIKYRDKGGHSVAGAVGVLPNKDVKQSSYLLNGQLTQMTTGVQGGMSEMLKNFKMPSGEEMIQAAKKIKVGLNTELLELRSSIVETLSQTASDAFVGMGEVVSAMISGTAGIANLGKMLGSVIGGTLQQVGKALVGFGVAKLNIDKLIAVPGFGAAAAIAGGALIAGLGATLKNITTPKAFASGGMVYSPTRALFGEYPGANSNPEVVAPLNTLLGMIQKTVEPMMLARMSPIPALRGSGGGGLEGILRGEDLYIQQRRVAASNAALRG